LDRVALKGPCLRKFKQRESFVQRQETRHGIDFPQQLSDVDLPIYALEIANNVHCLPLRSPSQPRQWDCSAVRGKFRRIKAEISLKKVEAGARGCRYGLNLAGMDATSSGVSCVIDFTMQPCAKPPWESATVRSQSSGLQIISDPRR